MHEFKIGQYIYYVPRNRLMAEGRYVVMRLLPQPKGEPRYIIRSQAQPEREYTAEAKRTAQGPAWAMNSCVFGGGLKLLVPGDRFLFAGGNPVELIDRQDCHRCHSAHQAEQDPEHCVPPPNGRIVVTNHGNIALGGERSGEFGLTVADLTLVDQASASWPLRC
jgi:hypothetical protein